MADKLYAKRDPRELGEFYTRHIMAMTEEGLHEKSDIAAELAYRDRIINRYRDIGPIYNEDPF